MPHFEFHRAAMNVASTRPFQQKKLFDLQVLWHLSMSPWDIYNLRITVQTSNSGANFLADHGLITSFYRDQCSWFHKEGNGWLDLQGFFISDNFMKLSDVLWEDMLQWKPVAPLYFWICSLSLDTQFSFHPVFFFPFQSGLNSVLSFLWA